MFNLLKYLKVIMMLKDVQEAYKEDTGKDRPWYMSRKFVGSVLATAGAAVGTYYGIEISETDVIEPLADQLMIVAGAVTGLYGAGMVIVSAAKKYIGMLKGK
jgi:hypothetical protein